MVLFWKVLSVMGLSSFMLIKLGIPAALTLNLSFVESVLYTSVGASIGVFVFVTVWDKVLTAIKHKRAQEKHNKGTPKKRFTMVNKILVKAKKRLGLIGISLVTPWMSFPLGCFVAVKYYQRDKMKIHLYMILSSFLWSILLCSIKLLFT